MGFHAIGDKAHGNGVGCLCAARRIVQGPQPDQNTPRWLTRPIFRASPSSASSASMQPNHLLTDMNWAEARLGPQRAAYSYAWKAFLDAGVHLAFGTDYPRRAHHAFPGPLCCAVTRKNRGFPKHKRVFSYGQQAGPGARLSMPIHRARPMPNYAAEKRKGKLVPGYYADFIHRRPRSVQSRRHSRNSSNSGVGGTYVNGKAKFFHPLNPTTQRNKSGLTTGTRSDRPCSTMAEPVPDRFRPPESWSEAPGPIPAQRPMEPSH